MNNKVLMITQNIAIFVKKYSLIAKNIEKYAIMITTQANIEGRHVI